MEKVSKRKVRVKSGVASVVVVLGVFFLLCSNAHATLIVTPVADGYAQDNIPLDGLGNVGNATGNSWDIGYKSGVAVYRGFIKFGLPTVPEGMTLESATLKVRMATQVNPSSPTNNNPTVNAVLYYSQADNTMEVWASHYQATTYQPTGLSVATPSQGDNTWVAMDVTQWIAGDYAAEGVDAKSSFRVQMADGWIPGTSSERYVFNSAETSASPVLELTFVTVPEPATIGLLSLASLFVLKKRHN